MAKSFSVLFVCTANLCRSPMASALFKDLLAKKFPSDAETDWLVESAGVWAVNGEPASLGAQAAMARRGLSLINHRSQQVTYALLEKFNLILVMEANHKEELQDEFSSFARKIFLLSEMNGASYDIKDPINRNILDYVATAAEIDGLIKQGFQKIYQMAK